MGGLGFFFLKGGGLDQIAVMPRAGQQSPSGGSQDRYQTPGPWAAAPVAPQRAQQASIGQTAGSPPVGAANGATIRIASFNIQTFGNTKAGKPYVMHTLADIVRQFDIVAIQEIRSKNEYLIPNFVRLINQSGRKFDHVIGQRLGRTTSKEQYVYIYDTERIDIDPQSIYTVGDPDDMMHRPPLIATFRTRGVHPDEAFTFTLVKRAFCLGRSLPSRPPLEPRRRRHHLARRF